MNTISSTMLFLLFALMATGCATIIKGSHESVPLVNYTPGTVIKDQYGIVIPVFEDNNIRTNRSANPYDRVTEKIDTIGRDYFVMLDVTERPVLTVERDGLRAVVVPNRRIGIGWIILDTVLGLYPAFIDASSGAWYTYTPITLPN